MYANVWSLDCLTLAKKFLEKCWQASEIKFIILPLWVLLRTFKLEGGFETFKLWIMFVFVVLVSLEVKVSIKEERRGGLEPWIFYFYFFANWNRVCATHKVAIVESSLCCNWWFLFQQILLSCGISISCKLGVIFLNNFIVRNVLLWSVQDSPIKC